MSQQIGIGRTTLLGALKRLESDYLVANYALRGTFTTSVDLTELADAPENPLNLGPLAGRKAAVHRGEPYGNSCPMRPSYSGPICGPTGSSVTE